MGLTPVPNDQLATVVTTLEMTERPALRPLPSSPLRLSRWRQPGADAYRILFRRVGGPWLWFSRLAMDDPTLLSIIHDPQIEIYAVTDSMGIEIGFVELDFRNTGLCELSYFGLVPELTGRGHGRWLMAETLVRAWRPGIERLRVHTCTLDHPSALNFYRAQNFTATKRTIETFADPRIAGLLPADLAPHVPLLTPLR
ncbi:GNAT family N-acetyltransferase [Sphingomonas sp.]|jgi:GNAT superfamily N-acetyltransferase|uniref:GNAT family N-acetyltransferase n=1 Tax=Sphingomonas sp. TaxID=28214 RepID=UPI002624B47F|nr:GNAT family N-acetyltransferase [Sphingomonas sp.]MDF2494140.1 family acetyltransferase [Sphingomonas sp.]